MNILNLRLKKIRNEYHLSQEEFGNKIGIESRAHISALENGNRNITDRIVRDVCREFNISEQWLRTGEGDMHIIPEDETAIIVSELLEEDNPFYDIIKEIVKTYIDLDDKSKKILQTYSKKLLENIKAQKKEG